MPARLFRITGRVQGVFFRAHAQELARKLQLSGWARNVEDGSVEIFAEGSAASLGEFEAWCHRGPPGAEVESVQMEETTGENLKTFEMRY